MTFPDPESQPTMSVAAAAGWLGIARDTAYELVRREEIPALRFGDRILIPTAALRALLQLDERPECAAMAAEIDALRTDRDRLAALLAAIHNLADLGKGNDG